jgi:hypothetical protein
MKLFIDGSNKRKLVNILLEFQVKGCLKKRYVLSLYTCREADIRLISKMKLITGSLRKQSFELMPPNNKDKDR